MSAPALPRNSLHSEAFTNIAGNALFGYLSATAFMTLNPFAGGLFGVFAGMTFSAIDYVTSCCCPHSTCAKTIRVALSLIASIAVGVGATTLCGYTLTFASGIFLTLSTVITTIAITAAFPCIYRTIRSL